MKDVDELIKEVNAQLDDLGKKVLFWESIKEYLEDIRNNDEMADQLKEG